eukprot:2735500-Prymnesium_polylepis.1
MNRSFSTVRNTYTHIRIKHRSKCRDHALAYAQAALPGAPRRPSGHCTRSAIPHVALFAARPLLLH